MDLYSILIEAINKYDVSTIKKISENGLNVKNIESLSFYIAEVNGLHQISNYLLCTGSLYYKDTYNYQFIWNIIENKQNKVLRLCKHVSIDAFCIGIIIAASRGSIDILKMLINIKYFKKDITVLHIALQYAKANNSICINYLEMINNHINNMVDNKPEDDIENSINPEEYKLLFDYVISFAQ
jgi:hypothetical protein